MPFSDFGFGKEILRAIQQAGYLHPTPIQSAAIPKAMEGRDLITIAQTGTGKTAAFVLPVLHRLSQRDLPLRPHGVRVLVLVPTRELAVQIMENIRNYGRHLRLRAAAIYGGVDEEAQIKALRKGVHFIVATPGRLLDLAGRREIDFSALETLVLDEADRMLHMGFLPDIETIVAALPGRRQTLMSSATLSKEIESLARRFLYQPQTVRIGKRADPADTVDQCVYEVPTHLKGVLLLELLRRPGFQKVLVFVRMKDGANRLTDFLKSARISVAKLHSSRSQEQRSRALQDFKDGAVRVLVATDIAARGIDVEGVTHVVNYDFPVNPEDYIHRIGRTGRAEALGEAVSFVPKTDLNLLHLLELSIGLRLPRKRLKNFDYRASAPAVAPGEKPAKRDWRKRTREREAKQAAANPPASAKSAARIPAKAASKRGATAGRKRSVPPPGIKPSKKKREPRP